MKSLKKPDSSHSVSVARCHDSANASEGFKWSMSGYCQGMSVCELEDIPGWCVALCMLSGRNIGDSGAPYMEAAQRASLITHNSQSFCILFRIELQKFRSFFCSL